MKCSFYTLACLSIFASLSLGCSKSTSPQPDKLNAAAQPLTTASPVQQPTMKVSEATENPSTKGDAEPGDPKLTYAFVVKNIDAYKGKRVRWYGRRVSFEITGGVTRATFMNVGQWQAGGDMDPFVARYRSEKEYFETPSEGWVTGTIEGTHTVGIRLGSPSGRETNTPRSVPLLSYLKIEKMAAR